MSPLGASRGWPGLEAEAARLDCRHTCKRPGHKKNGGLTALTFRYSKGPKGILLLPTWVRVLGEAHVEVAEPISVYARLVNDGGHG